MLAGLVAGVTVLAVGAVPAPAQAPPALPVVSLGTVAAPHREMWVDCQGASHVAHLSQGYAEVIRDDTGVVDPAPVDVAVSYSGDLAPALHDPAASTSVGPAGEYSSIGLDTARGVDGTLTVTLAPGPGYAVGDPSSGSFTLDSTGLYVRADCTDPLPLMWGAARQTIGVGERPGGLGITVGEGGEVRIQGTLPPGLSLDDDALWVGTATTPGTYSFEITYCVDTLITYGDLPQVLCLGTSEVQIAVERAAGSSGPTPPPAATPATPVSAAARLTG